MAILTIMISVSLTEKQNENLVKEATVQDRKVGAQARILIVEGLKRLGYSTQEEDSEDGT